MTDSMRPDAIRPDPIRPDPTRAGRTENWSQVIGGQRGSREVLDDATTIALPATPSAPMLLDEAEEAGEEVEEQASDTGSGTVTLRKSKDAGVEVRRSTSNVRRTDIFALFGALSAGVSMTFLLYIWIAPFSGMVGFVVLAYLFSLLFYALLVSLDENALIVRDRVASVFMHSMALLVIIALGCVIVFTFIKSYPALHHLNFYTQDMTRAGPLDPLTVGGVKHAMIGTLEQIGIALAITVPLGISTAVFLSMARGLFSRTVRTIVDAMSALPSIIAGLFIYASIILALGFNKCGFAASLAISITMLPIIIRSADVVLRLVPGSLKEASLALGSSQWRTIWHVILPTARSGLFTAVILGAARGIGESAEVLVTAGFTPATTWDPFSGPQVSLPLAGYSFVSGGFPSMVARGFGAVTVLLVLVLILFVVARSLGGRGAGQLSRRQARRRDAQSQRAFERIGQRHHGGIDLVRGPSVAAVGETS